jgi:hypothetical protein
LIAALLLVWLVISLVTAAAIVAPFMLPERMIAALTPVCESKRLYGRECFLCGTTTAFIAISRGEWRRAAELNRGAIPLYAFFAVNAIAAACVLSRRAVRRTIAGAMHVR